MTVRHAIPSDRLRVVAMLKAAHAAGGLPFPFSAPHAAALFEGCALEPDRACLVINVSGRAEGVLIATAAEHPFGPFRIASELVWWVEAKHRGAGAYAMMQSLIAAYEAWAISRGCSYAGLGAMQTSERLEVLYRRQGYGPIEAHFIKSLAN